MTAVEQSDVVHARTADPNPTLEPDGLSISMAHALLAAQTDEALSLLVTISQRANCTASDPLDLRARDIAASIVDPTREQVVRW